MASSLAARMLAAAPKSKAALLNQTSVGDKVTIAKFAIPMVNLMMSGSINGGMTCGIQQIVGDSRTFKTNFSIFCISQYMKQHPDSVCVFLDSEFSAKPVFKQYGIDESRIVYIPFENLEEMKIYLAQMIKEAERGDNIFFFIDSISQVASLKEVTDATKGEVKVDMTRAKEMNSVFRMITPMLNIRNLPLFCINSFYDDTDSQYADPIIKGGKQSFLSSDTVWFVTRAQDKGDEGLKGWYFNYKALKSRFVKEKAVFKIHVTYDGGIDWASGLLELAVESKLVKQSGAWYELDASLKTEGFDKKFQRKDIDKKETGFLDIVLADPRFDDYCRAKYMLKDEEKMLLDQQLLEAEAQELN